MEKTPIRSAHFAFDAVSCVAHFSFHAVPKCWKNLGDQMAADLSGTGQNLSFSAQRLFIIKEHLDSSSPTSVLHLFFCRSLSGVLTHDIHLVLIVRWMFGFSFLGKNGLPKTY